MPQDAPLPDNIIRDINYAVTRLHEDDTRKKFSISSAVAWLSNVGALISEWLPQILTVLKAIAAAAPSTPGVPVPAPTLSQFCRMQCKMFGENGMPASAPVMTGKQTVVKWCK